MRHGGNILAVARRHGWDWRTIADFSASINPLGPAPAVRAAVIHALDRMAHYPEADSLTLRRTLARHWDTHPDRLLEGSGATEVIHFLGREISGPVYLAAPVFSEFPRAFPGAVTVPFDSRAWPTDGLVVVTRPANPTGAMPDLSHWKHPLLIDESFIEFTGEPSLVSSLDRHPDWIVLRSLTKFHAIPGLRIGVLAAAPERIAQWRRRRGPWTVNIAAEAAVEASLADGDHARRTLDFVRSERAWLIGQWSRLPGWQPVASAANYILAAADRPVAPLVAALEQRRILVRDCSGWPGVEPPHAIRAAVRPREENLRLLEALCAV